mmetsp:Transcript_11847/g.30049  ORF Transcript_11847/g.30049 Transcript_11847/m.30049 type:complete len:83 (-) Transcript_11847:88-336(-)
MVQQSSSSPSAAGWFLLSSKRSKEMRTFSNKTQLGFICYSNDALVLYHLFVMLPLDYPPSPSLFVLLVFALACLQRFDDVTD